MNGLGFDWHQAARASLLLVLVLLGFGILGAAAGWPNAQSGWPLAIAVAIGAALLPFAGAILDMLRDSRAKLETPWLKLDFAGAAEAATQRGEALSLPANLLRPGAAYADSGSTELEAAAERAKGDPDAVVDLADGGAWWETRLFALAASADMGVRQRVDLDDVVQRWQLIRPTVELQRTGALPPWLVTDASTGHLLQALLNNAADASRQAGSQRVDLDLRCEGDELVGTVRDYGNGFHESVPFQSEQLFRTSKPEGMGVGLALSHATIERLGGRMTMRAVPPKGVQVQFRLPVAGNDESP